MKIEMVDLKGQYLKIKKEIDQAIQKVIDDTSFINGSQVKEFSTNLASYCNVKHVIPCANGTDALQIALMALDLKQGDEILVPAFTYVASAEVIGLLGLTPVMVDVDYDSFNVTASNFEKAITPKTKVMIPVHLFGQSCDMDPILKLAEKYQLFVVEDNAQALGAVYTFPNGEKAQTGTIGDIGCTSFFPSKNLGCYGDGGALMTNNDQLAEKLQMICNHGQKVKYTHTILGCNSRLDTIQAAILNVKLNYLKEYSDARLKAGLYYSEKLKDNENVICPSISNFSTHVFHQYTLKIKNNKRDSLKDFLNDKKIPAMIYYPLPLQQQEAFKAIAKSGEKLKLSQDLSNSVLSLPIHTEITLEQQDIIIIAINDFFKQANE